MTSRSPRRQNTAVDVRAQRQGSARIRPGHPLAEAGSRVCSRTRSSLLSQLRAGVERPTEVRDLHDNSLMVSGISGHLNLKVRKLEFPVQGHNKIRPEVFGLSVLFFLGLIAAPYINQREASMHSAPLVWETPLPSCHGNSYSPLS